MKKTFNINLGGLIFHVDEDAFNKLENYLGTLKRQFAKTEGGEEIVKDVELRMAELFRQRTSHAKEVVSLEDIDQVIAIMGQPEDYMDQEQEAADGDANEQVPPYVHTNRKIFRDGDDRILGGVSSGFAAYFNIDPVWVRILFVALLFTGFGLPLYIVLWIVVPRAKTTAEKLQMRGEPVTLTNIERSIKEEAAQVSRRFKSYADGARKFDYREGFNRTGGFFNDLGRFIVDLVKLVFRLIFKLLGFLFLVLGFIFLGALVLAIFSGSIEILGDGYALDNVFDFLSQVVASETHYNALVTGLSLLLAAPLFILIYMGIRLLFKVEPLNKQVRSGLAILAFVGFALTVYSGVRIAYEFKRDAWFSQKVNVPLSGITQIEVLQDSIYERFVQKELEEPMIFTQGSIAMEMVKLDIRQSTKGYAYLETEIEARGSTREEANRNARMIKYAPQLDSGKFTFPIYYLLPPEEKFRAQEVDITLYLMPGDTISLGEGTQHLIYAVANLNNYWDYDMAGHTWTMTEDGLLCADCLDSPEILERLEKEKAEAERQKELEKQSQESEVRSDSDKVIISAIEIQTSRHLVEFLTSTGLLYEKYACLI